MRDLSDWIFEGWVWCKDCRGFVAATSIWGGHAERHVCKRCHEEELEFNIDKLFCPTCNSQLEYEVEYHFLVEERVKCSECGYKAGLNRYWKWRMQQLRGALTICQDDSEGGLTLTTCKGAVNIVKLT